MPLFGMYLTESLADQMQNAGDQANIRYSHVELIRYAFTVCGYEGSNEHCTLKAV